MAFYNDKLHPDVFNMTATIRKSYCYEKWSMHFCDVCPKVLNMSQFIVYSLQELCGRKIIDCMRSVDDVIQLPLPEVIIKQLETLIPRVEEYDEDSDNDTTTTSTEVCNVCYSTECDCLTCPSCERKYDEIVSACEYYCNAYECTCCAFCTQCGVKYNLDNYNCDGGYCKECHYDNAHFCSEYYP